MSINNATVQVRKTNSQILRGFAQARGVHPEFLIVKFVEEYFNEKDPGPLTLDSLEDFDEYEVSLTPELLSKLSPWNERMPQDLLLGLIVENRVRDRQED